ncbi:hypothetical protein BAUCODRAFT_31853 [Baudoinia panamericana UAMH 10762]|uniref:Uncharacterized protein n=1 Tax=Baudoinia panamericana (strain UAMH 10762) TaxID=717646 RepID=M2LTI5_BAUPA|nr:uncharacterized protein BAUCODRAFT_31853 [Baudoinia panamericana UAMH 10762]EMC97847.1 hypothetical protein BAUCODRAFT_31853 [Baudoinia panamericana UAMH 10762]
MLIEVANDWVRSGSELNYFSLRSHSQSETAYNSGFIFVLILLQVALKMSSRNNECSGSTPTSP